MVYKWSTNGLLHVLPLSTLNVPHPLMRDSLKVLKFFPAGGANESPFRGHGICKSLVSETVLTFLRTQWTQY